MAKRKIKFLTRFQNPKRLLIICIGLTIVSEIIFWSVHDTSFSYFSRGKSAQTIQWQPWNKAAFEKAGKENKKIFLNIGYPTCYFCQRMNQDVFQNKKIIETLNRDFISIQINRDLFPEVDQFYMEFVQRQFGQAGWPLNVVLTADAQPLVGGVNFPRKELVRLLHAVHAAPPRSLNPANVVDARPGKFPENLAQAYDGVLEKNFDFFYGGFGNFPKFPPTTHLRWLEYGLKTKPNENHEQRLRLLNTTLLGMVRGGFFDHVDGGFFHYSLDAKWQVPSFEKTLFDQALLASNYTEAYALTKDKVYANVAQHTLDFVLHHLTAPSGVFFTALNSQSQGSEGDYYLWNPGDIAPYQSIFFIHHPNHYQTPSGLLFIKETQFLLSPDYDTAIQSLAQIRSARPRPKRDENILTSGNGLMLGALSRASIVLKQPQYLKSALASAEYIQKNLFVNGHLVRGQNNQIIENSASLEDYVFLIHGLLNLYEVSGQPRWREWAIHLQKKQDELFWDQNFGGYFSTSIHDQLLPIRPKVFIDEAKPSANGLAASNLVRFYQIKKQPTYLNKAKALLGAAASTMNQSPFATPQCHLATAMVQIAETR